MNKQELSKILANPISKVNLYNFVVLRDDDESEFNEQDYSRFVFRNFWYKIHLANPEVLKEINEKMGSDGTFDGFYAKLIENNLYNKYYKKCEEYLHTDTNWACSRYIGLDNVDGKIYLSADNDQLYYLADELLKGVITEEMQDYDFKVNCDKSISRRDGIVIYFNKNNFKQYIKIIRAIQREHPEIRFNEPNCFAYRYNNTIGIGKDYKDGSSFTSKCCDVISRLDLRRPEYSLENIEKSINEHLKDVIGLCRGLDENESR